MTAFKYNLLLLLSNRYPNKRTLKKAFNFRRSRHHKRSAATILVFFILTTLGESDTMKKGNIRHLLMLSSAFFADSVLKESKATGALLDFTKLTVYRNQPYAVSIVSPVIPLVATTGATNATTATVASAVGSTTPTAAQMTSVLSAYVLQITPQADYEGPASILIKNGTTPLATAKFMVTRRPPQTKNLSVLVSMNSISYIPLNTYNPDKSFLSFVRTNAGSSALSYNASTDVLTYTPSLNFTGLETVAYRLDDKTYKSTNQGSLGSFIDIRVVASSVFPYGSSFNFTNVKIFRNQPYSVFLASFPISSAANVTVITPALDVKTTLSSSMLVIEPQNDYEGPVNIQLSNGIGNQPAILNFSVTRRQPKTKGLMVSGLMNQSITIPLDMSDNPDQAKLTFSLTANPNQSTLNYDPTLKQLTYTPPTGFIGVDKIRYRFDDNSRVSANQGTIADLVIHISPISYDSTLSQTTLDNLSVKSKLNVTGATTLSDTLTVNSDITSLNGNILLKSKLNGKGNFVAGNVPNIGGTNNLILGGSATVNGANNVVVGSSGIVTGSNNTVLQSSGSISGSGNMVTTNNKSVTTPGNIAVGSVDITQGTGQVFSQQDIKSVNGSVLLTNDSGKGGNIVLGVAPNVKGSGNIVLAGNNVNCSVSVTGNNNIISGSQKPSSQVFGDGNIIFGELSSTSVVKGGRNFVLGDNVYIDELGTRNIISGDDNRVHPNGVKNLMLGDKNELGTNDGKEVLVAASANLTALQTQLTDSNVITNTTKRDKLKSDLKAQGFDVSALASYILMKGLDVVGNLDAGPTHENGTLTYNAFQTQLRNENLNINNTLLAYLILREADDLGTLDHDTDGNIKKTPLQTDLASAGFKTIDQTSTNDPKDAVIVNTDAITAYLMLGEAQADLTSQLLKDLKNSGLQVEDPTSTATPKTQTPLKVDALAAYLALKELEVHSFSDTLKDKLTNGNLSDELQIDTLEQGLKDNGLTSSLKDQLDTLDVDTTAIEAFLVWEKIEKNLFDLITPEFLLTHPNLKSPDTTDYIKANNVIPPLRKLTEAEIFYLEDLTDTFEIGTYRSSKVPTEKTTVQDSDPTLTHIRNALKSEINKQVEPDVNITSSQTAYFPMALLLPDTFHLFGEDIKAMIRKQLADLLAEKLRKRITDQLIAEVYPPTSVPIIGDIINDNLNDLDELLNIPPSLLMNDVTVKSFNSSNAKSFITDLISQQLAAQINKQGKKEGLTFNLDKSSTLVAAESKVKDLIKKQLTDQINTQLTANSITPLLTNLSTITNATDSVKILLKQLLIDRIKTQFRGEGVDLPDPITATSLETPLINLIKKQITEVSTSTSNLFALSNIIFGNENNIGLGAKSNVIGGNSNQLYAGALVNIVTGDQNIVGKDDGQTVNFDDFISDPLNASDPKKSEKQVCALNFIYGNKNSLSLYVQSNIIGGDKNELSHRSMLNFITGDSSTLSYFCNKNTISGNSNQLGLLVEKNDLSGNFNVIGGLCSGNKITGSFNLLGLLSSGNIIAGSTNVVGIFATNNNIAGNMNAVGIAAFGNTINGGLNAVGLGAFGNLLYGGLNAVGLMACNNIIFSGTDVSFDISNPAAVLIKALTVSLAVIKAGWSITAGIPLGSVVGGYAFRNIILGNACSIIRASRNIVLGDFNSITLAKQNAVLGAFNAIVGIAVSDLMAVSGGPTASLFATNFGATTSINAFGAVGNVFAGVQPLPPGSTTPGAVCCTLLFDASGAKPNVL